MTRLLPTRMTPCASTETYDFDACTEEFSTSFLMTSAMRLMMLSSAEMMVKRNFESS